MKLPAASSGELYPKRLKLTVVQRSLDNKKIYFYGYK